MNEGDLKENCDFQSITTRASRHVERTLVKDDLDENGDFQGVKTHAH